MGNKQDSQSNINLSGLGDYEKCISFNKLKLNNLSSKMNLSQQKVSLIYKDIQANCFDSSEFDVEKELL